MLGFTDNEPSWLATANKPGVNYIAINPQEAEKIKPLIESINLLIMA